jgi:hypothetical protein
VADHHLSVFWFSAFEDAVPPMLLKSFLLKSGNARIGADVKAFSSLEMFLNAL